MNKFTNYFDLLKVKTYNLDLSLILLTEPRLNYRITKIKKNNFIFQEFKKKIL